MAKYEMSQVFPDNYRKLSQALRQIRELCHRIKCQQGSWDNITIFSLLIAVTDSPRAGIGEDPYFATASPSISTFLIVVLISYLSYFPCMHAVEI